MPASEGHYTCPDCQKRCRCYFPQGQHEACERRRSVHLIVMVPKPEKPRKPSKAWPAGLYEYIIERDGGCVAHRLGLSDRDCYGRVQVDHVRHSGGLAMKSPTEAWNLVSLCGQHHYDKTTHQGGDWREVLVDYLNEKEDTDYPVDYYPSTKERTVDGD